MRQCFHCVNFSFKIAILLQEGLSGILITSAYIDDCIDCSERPFPNLFTQQIDRSVSRSSCARSCDARAPAVHIELQHWRRQHAVSRSRPLREYRIDVGEELCFATVVGTELDFEGDFGTRNAHFDCLEARKDDPREIRPDLVLSLAIVANSGAISRSVLKYHSALCIKSDRKVFLANFLDFLPVSRLEILPVHELYIAAWTPAKYKTIVRIFRRSVKG